MALEATVARNCGPRRTRQATDAWDHRPHNNEAFAHIMRLRLSSGGAAGATEGCGHGSAEVRRTCARQAEKKTDKVEERKPRTHGRLELLVQQSGGELAARHRGGGQPPFGAQGLHPRFLTCSGHGHPRAHSNAHVQTAPLIRPMTPPWTPRPTPHDSARSNDTAARWQPVAATPPTRAPQRRRWAGSAASTRRARPRNGR